MWITLALCVACAVGCWQLWRYVRLHLRQSLQGCAIVVTGCDSGLGYAIAKRLCDEKAVVIATCLTQPGIERCRALGASIKPVLVDITSDEDVNKLLATVEAELASRKVALKGLVNNAGLGNYGFAEALDLARFRLIMEVNCLGTVRVTKAFLPLLRKHGQGARLVTMGSLSDRLPAGFGSAYVPTKAYACFFTDCVAAEIRRFGVHTSIIEPGFIATELLDSAQSGGAKACDSAKSDVVEAYGEFAPMMTELRGSVTLCEKLNGGKEGGAAWVADSVVDALSSSWPRSRYLVGNETKVLMWLPRLPGWSRLLCFIFEQQHRKVHS
eukprot:TRINITY_DN22438_c0_g1_i1.p1 TRINITY_DN22438_c0_g1~~TRINITY_DN22438_c0_g1_i1.p1  ORF type:complete len:326 (+),score=31.27 TRINITY_DN22438_c0_g1_i1:95-1072(+)